MPRIPDDQIERLKTEISLQRLAEGHGIKLKKHGKDHIGLCPFHDDHDPSLVISPDKNLFHCLGCGAGGSVIDWVMKIEGVSFRHAVELLQADYDPSSLAAHAPVKQATVPKLAAPLKRNTDDQQLLNQVIDYYHGQLKQNVDALSYLEKRGLKNDELIEYFKLGVSDRTLGYRLPRKNRKEGAELRGQLQRIGIYRESGHEHFNGSLVIPVIDEQGNITEVYGRKLNENLRKGTPKHCYLPGPHEGIFNIEALKASHEIILCESLIDALTFWNAGYRNMTCSYGIEGFTDHHLAAFKQYEIQRILIAYDRDEGGNNAAEKLAERLTAEGIECFRILFPKGMDANEYALSVQPASKSLGVVIRSAEWMGKGKAPERQLDIETQTSQPNTNQSSPLVAEPPSEPATKHVPDTDPGEITLPASPMPKPGAEVEAIQAGSEIFITLGDRKYRIRGLAKNTGIDTLKVNVLVAKDELVYVDTFDLYAARPRAAYIKQASHEIGISEDVIKTDLGKVLLKLEALQEAQQDESTPESKVVEINDTDRQAALALLKDQSLMTRIIDDYQRCGVVGEAVNKQVAYLACVSRMLESPLAVMVQSTSAAGKSSLMDAALAFIPEEHRIQYSAMTGQSLFYMSGKDLKHKILSVAEEAGASEASYALKLLQSEGQLTIASTGKDGDTGKLITQEYHVEGPVMIFSTTTAIDLDEELLNRCLVLSVNENREQTKAIHELQRKRRTLEGLLQRKDKEQILNLHRNAQRLLKPLAVVNPYAEQLTFLDDRTRTRRDHEKYLTLIESIALLHQYQREIKTALHDGQNIEYIEVTLNDIELANQLAHEVLGRTLDELPPQTRNLLLLIDSLVNEQSERLEMKKSDYRFSRKVIRDYTGWGDTQLRVHLQRLTEMEYLLCHGGSRGQRYVYELLYNGQGQDGQPFVMGLVDTDSLKSNGTTKRTRGKTSNNAGVSRPHSGVNAGSTRSNKNTRKASDSKVFNDDEDETTPDAYISRKNNGASYRSDNPALVARSE